MNRYQNGKVYVIRNSIDDLVYVGSTCMPLYKRWYKHKNRCNDLNCNYKLYQHMRDLDIENFYIELYEDCPCDNKEQLTRREGEIMRQLNAQLNMRVAGRNKKEYYKENQKKIKEYYHNNSEKILKQKKEYYQKNKEAIKKYNREYYLKNKLKIKEKNKLKKLKNNSDSESEDDLKNI